jgi:branched-chain amino acid transport system permease protein
MDINQILTAIFGTVFLQQIVNGLTIGAFYALIALGYTMVYGILRLINFAHGDIFMLGSYVGWALVLALISGGAASGNIGIVLLALFIVPAVAVGITGVALERLAYRPLRMARAGILTLLISALGASLVLQNGVMLATGAQPQAYPNFLPIVTIYLGSARVTLVQLSTFIIAIALMVGLQLFVQNTKMGKAMRAVALSHDTARLMGVDVDRIIALTFFIGSALAAVAGVMTGLHYTQITFNQGFIYGLKAFVACVIGGVGNIPGAMVGGFILGILETMAAGYIKPEWKDVVAFVVLITLLVVKPTGLLGERVVEKV